MSRSLIQFDPLLPDEQAERFHALVDGLGELHMYVEGQIESGIGAGLVRRHDALMNYIRQGGAGSLEGLAARINPYRRTLAELAEIFEPGAELLLHHEPFMEAAREVTGSEFVEPTMLYTNVMLPGQELPIHNDTPKYVGLDQTNCPEWLLVAMMHSGLFEDVRIRYAGAVSFWGTCEGGDFLCYPDGPGGEVRRVPAKNNTAVVLDGDATFHGVASVGAPGAPTPEVELGMTLGPADDATWAVRKDGEVVEEIARSSLRISVQWKACCYADEADRGRKRAGEGALTRQSAVDQLVADMRSRARLGKELPDDTQLALEMLDEYVSFPAPR